jgi:hypothetical protein
MRLGERCCRRLVYFHIDVRNARGGGNIETRTKWLNSRFSYKSHIKADVTLPYALLPGEIGNDEF